MKRIHIAPFVLALIPAFAGCGGGTTYFKVEGDFCTEATTSDADGQLMLQNPSVAIYGGHTEGSCPSTFSGQSCQWSTSDSIYGDIDYAKYYSGADTTALAKECEAKKGTVK